MNLLMLIEVYGVCFLMEFVYEIVVYILNLGKEGVKVKFEELELVDNSKVFVVGVG